MTDNQFWERLRQTGIIPVVKIALADKAPALARSLLEGGLPAIEITFRTNAAANAIAAIAKQEPDILICAGTVLNVETAKRAMDAGASGIISPGTNPEVVRWCMEQGIPLLPGCASPTEVEACIRMGLSVLKLFPATVVGGVEMLKALAGPYAAVSFMPTGGINPENAADYLALSNVIAVGGSWIASEKDIESGNFETIRANTKQASEIVASISRI